jgi:hypothetical protein
VGLLDSHSSSNTVTRGIKALLAGTALLDETLTTPYDDISLLSLIFDDVPSLVSYFLFVQMLGAPSEDQWPGVMALPFAGKISWKQPSRCVTVSPESSMP